MSDLVVKKQADGSIVIQDGETAYPLCRLEVEDVKAIIGRFKARQRDPLLVALNEVGRLKDLPVDFSPAEREAVRKEILDRAYADLKVAEKDRAPDPKAVAVWADHTDDGAAYSLYLMLRRKTPTVTEEQAAALLVRLDRKAFVAQRDAALSQETLEAAQRGLKE